MKCLLCGSENNDGMKFCTQCGAMLTQPEEVKQEKEETVETVEVAESAETVVEVPTEAVAAAVETPVMETPVAEVVVPVTEEAVAIPEAPVVKEVTAPEAPVVEAVAAPIPPMPPVPPMPPMPKTVTITDKELKPVRENAWTAILKGVTLFFYILELVAVVIITVLRVMGTDVIPIPRMPMVTLIIFAVGAVLVLTLMFVITMCLLNVASDITKSRKHMRNIEYILRKK